LPAAWFALPRQVDGIAIIGSFKGRGIAFGLVVGVALLLDENPGPEREAEVR